MKLGTQLHLAGLSLSDPFQFSNTWGFERCRTTVHNWIQKADLLPEGGCNPNHVALDEPVIQVNDQRYSLYAAVDPDTNRLLHIRLYPTRTTVLTEMFLAALREKHLVDDAVFLVDRVPWLQAALHHHGLRFYHETYGNRNAVERVFKKLKRRTNELSNHFRNANPDTAETMVASVRSLVESANLNNTFINDCADSIGGCDICEWNPRSSNRSHGGPRIRITHFLPVIEVSVRCGCN